MAPAICRIGRTLDIAGGNKAVDQFRGTVRRYEKPLGQMADCHAVSFP